MGVDPQPTELVLGAIGHISFTAQNVHSPAGSAPLNKVTWCLRVADQRSAPWRPWRPSRRVEELFTVSVTAQSTHSPRWRYTEDLEDLSLEQTDQVRRDVTAARMQALRTVVHPVLALPDATAPPDASLSADDPGASRWHPNRLPPPPRGNPLP